MNYWPAYVTNLLETAFPVINYIDDLRVYGRHSGCKVCRNRLSGRGGEWLVGSYSSDPFGWTAPGWDYYWGWSPAANAWMMQTVYEAYSFYRDQDYLREKIYPMLRETVRFGMIFYMRISRRSVGYLLRLIPQNMVRFRLAIPMTNL